MASKIMITWSNHFRFSSPARYGCGVERRNRRLWWFGPRSARPQNNLRFMHLRPFFCGASHIESSVKVARGFTPGTPGLPGGFRRKNSCPWCIPVGFLHRERGLQSEKSANAAGASVGFVAGHHLQVMRTALSRNTSLNPPTSHSGFVHPISTDRFPDSIDLGARITIIVPRYHK